MEFGIELFPGPSDENAEALKQQVSVADAAGLDIVVLGRRPGAVTPGLDLWTSAAWILGSTPRIAVGIRPEVDTPDTSDGTDFRLSAVESNVRSSAEILAPGRLQLDPALWVEVPADIDLAGLKAAASEDAIVVAPVASVDEIVGFAELVQQLRGVEKPQRRRSSAVRTRRAPGIDYDDVPMSLLDSAVEPGDAAYRSVSSTYMRAGTPGLVLRPESSEQVADAIGYARRHRNLPLGVRSGGHGISGRSTNSGGIIIDLGRLNRVEVLDADRRLVKVGAGATWKQVNNYLGPYGWAIGSGDYGGVGVGGLATAGGIGFLSREFGLTIDSVTAVELVTADGSQRRVDHNNDPELFWAMRGAGANFGIATAFEFEAHPVGAIGWAQLTLVVEDMEKLLYDFGEAIAAAPRDTNIFMVTGRPRQNQFVVQLYGIVDSDDPQTIIARLTPFAQLGQLAGQEVVLTRYMDIMSRAADVGPDGHQGMGEPTSRSGLLNTMTREFAHEAAELIASGKTYFFQIRPMGGAVADVSPDETAFSHRSAAMQITAMSASDRMINGAWDGLRRHFSGNYLSFETDQRPERLLEVFPPTVLGRLVVLKRRLDPENIFRDNFNIDPNLDLSQVRAAAAEKVKQ